jgi:hypothetical protein
MKKVYTRITLGLTLILISLIGAMFCSKELRNWFFKTLDESFWLDALACTVLIVIFGIPVYIDYRRKKLKKS